MMGLEWVSTGGIPPYPLHAYSQAQVASDATARAHLTAYEDPAHRLSILPSIPLRSIPKTTILKLSFSTS